jgi:RNA polymerase sigma-70 factor (ECF subfamily)
MLWAYFARATGDSHGADDLLQEAYYRFLRARVDFESEAHRRHYLFRIASNLVRDRYRRPIPDQSPLPENCPAAAPGDLASETEERTDLHRAMARLSPRERDLLWLAYGEGSSHQEIAGALGLTAGSVKSLLFRARRKLAALLQRDDR